MVLLLLLASGGCSVKQQKTLGAEEVKAKLESKYQLEFAKTDVEGADKSVTYSIISPEIKEKNGLIIVVHYNASLPLRSYIMYINHDDSIPAKLYYPVEPIRMNYEDKQQYEDYKDELESAYQDFLSELELTSDDLFSVAQYGYEETQTE